MNCPHGWTQIDPGTECGTCWAERTAAESATRRKLATLTRELVACDHSENTARWTLASGRGELEWCAHCGARRYLKPLNSRWILPDFANRARKLQEKS